MMKTTITKILAERHYLMTTNEVLTGKDNAYFNTYLLTNFGIIIDKPELLTIEAVKTIADIFKLNVPASFYDNPQDMKYYTKAELLVEQIVSYFLVETVGYFDRVKLFEKDLPEYKIGNELKLREFKMVTSDEAVSVLKDITKALCAYTRPFSLEETDEFEVLYSAGYYDGFEIKCRDNIFNLLQKDLSFAHFLDKKDLVKLSIATFGDYSKFNRGEPVSYNDTFKLIAACLPLVRNCPMSKKQAKYFNKLLSVCNVRGTLASNAKSPYKLAGEKMRMGDVLGAAKIYAQNGSLLERNIKYLLSRANPIEAAQILDLLPAKNPIALYQLVSTLAEDSGESRTFTFTKNNRVKRHNETDYETKWRKSKLNDSTRKLLHDISLNKIKEYYASLDSLGKVYIADNFYKIGIPTNTSAGGKGIDVVPTGSRLPCTATNIRSFVYWHGIYDVDYSLIAVKADGSMKNIYFGNYSSKPFGNAILFSGDERDYDGAEYFDIKLDELAKQGYVMLIQAVNGFSGKFTEGETICGYQNKDNLETKAWDPKNIEMQFQIKGDSRAALAFGIDLNTREIIMLNIVRDSMSRVVDNNEFDSIKKYFDPSCLELNMGLVINSRGTVVATPEEADFVFDDNYTPTETQKAVRTYELEKLVAIANGGDLN